MRVAIWHNLASGGAKRALRDHIAGLLERGHDVEVWRPPGPADELMALDALAPEHVVPLSFDGDPLWWRPGRLGLLRSPRPLMRSMCDHSRAVAAEMAAGRFDVHFIGTCSVFGSPPIGRFVGGPSVLYLQEPHRWLYEACPEFPWLAPGTGTSALRRATLPVRSALQMVRVHRFGQRARFEVDNALAFDELLVNSRFSRETVLRVYGRSATVCRLGIDTRRFQLRDGRREDVVVGVGQFVRHKRVDALVAAVAGLDPPRPRVEWVAATQEGGYRCEVEAQALRTGVDLVIHQAAGDDFLVELLNRARVLVYTPRLEPFGLVPLEAAACGLAVIGIAEGGVRETVVHDVSGLLVDDDGPALVEALRALLGDPDRAERMGLAGREMVEQKWAQEAANDRLEGLLQDVAERFRIRS